MRLVALAFVPLVGLLAAPAAAQPDKDLVKAELLADVSAIKPGEAFTVGVRLKIEPGWHVYWTNPGDSGAPTTVKLKLPAGFKAAPAQYPLPIRFNQPGDVLGYGYEDELMLTVRVTPPAGLKPDTDVTVTADAAWLCCKDACIPGRAKLALKLPVSGEGSKAPPANAKVFEEWSARMPRDEHELVRDAEWDTAAAADGTLVHTINWKSDAPATVELFPGRTDAVEFQEVDATSAGNATRVTIRAQLRPGPPPESKALASLLVYTDSAGKRHGIPVEIPVDKLKPAPAD